MHIQPSWEKAYFEEITVLDTEIGVYIDGENKKIHLLDRNNPGTRTLENAMRMEYLGYLALTINSTDLSIYDVYLYQQDGDIVEFNVYTDESIKVDPGDLHLYEPFKKICATRYMATNPII